MNGFKRDIGIKEILLVAALIAALYGGFSGVHKIAVDEANHAISEHQTIKQIQDTQSTIKEQVGRIDERTKLTAEAVARVEKKLDEDH